MIKESQLKEACTFKELAISDYFCGSDKSSVWEKTKEADPTHPQGQGKARLVNYGSEQEHTGSDIIFPIKKETIPKEAIL